MLAFIQCILFFLLLIVLQILAQHRGFKPSITCYMKYNHEETKSQTSNTLLSYSYHEAEITQFVTPEGEICSKVGCACFSYRGVCSQSSPGANHYSSCKNEDRQNGIIKWHYGWASHDQCEELRKHPNTYLDLTCCYTDRCNDQPGKITKVIDTPLPIQQQDIYSYQGQYSGPDSGQHPLPTPYKPSQHHDTYDYQGQYSGPYSGQHPLPAPYKPSQHYDTYAYQTPQSLPITQKPSPRYNSHVHHTTTSRLSDAYKPSPTYDRSLPRSGSLSSSSFSIWMIFFALIFCLLITV